MPSIEFVNTPIRFSYNIPEKLQIEKKFKMLVQYLTSLVLLVTTAAATIYYAGVAESGGEFGVYSRLKTTFIVSKTG